ncbi:unnamed protein product [Diabrotica balteata]|uniref:Uncharacterized protein n=1 Tax=Diabrotica balteata TaxID=107213 RepID=A0A9N9SQ59_DIABA|nr:unnamed protein product [Diabrotica balteata]
MIKQRYKKRIRQEAIEGIIVKGTQNIQPHDQVGFTFCSNDFARGQGWMRFRPASEVTFDDVWNKISSIYQSNSTGLNTETFCLGITTVKMPAGKGRGYIYNSFNEECSKRRGIVVIKNTDNLCLPRALVVAKAYVDKDLELTKIRKDTGKIQREKALQLMKNAGVVIPDEGAGISELQQFQLCLTGLESDIDLDILELIGCPSLYELDSDSDSSKEEEEEEEEREEEEDKEAEEEASISLTPPPVKKTKKKIEK